MKKILTSFITLLLVLHNSAITQANNTDINMETPKEIAERLNKNNPFNEIIENGSIKIDGDEVKLYVTFKNQEEALKQMKIKYRDTLNKIKLENNLDILNQDNFQSYFDILNTNEYENINQEDKEKMILFFDIYENKGFNDTIIKNANLYKTDPKEEYKIAIDIVSPMYNSSISTFFKESARKNRASMPLPNLNAAISYARKYATSPNPAYAYWGNNGGDCTNFVSQILNAGGVAQVYTGNEMTGWWYRSKSSRSISWINAQTFARYMGGINHIYNNFSAVVGPAQPGTFIGGSTHNDGNLNHLGFVTNKSLYELEIAQHSSNYIGWTNGKASAWKKGRAFWIIR